MNSRERFLVTLQGGKADRVPCTPDFSNMIPCRLTGKPFWDIYLNGDPPLWQAYLDAADHFGIDAWFYDGRLTFQYADDGVWNESKVLSRDDERVVKQTILHTPHGDMESQTTYYRADPPTPTVKPVKDIAGEIYKWLSLFRVPTGYNTEYARMQKAKVGGRHAFGAVIGFPGFQSWCCATEGGVEPLAYVQADHPELLEEVREAHERAVLKQVEMILDCGLFEHLLVGGSGAVTLASPELFDRYALPTIKKVTRMCKQAGLPTILHSCGKEKYLVKQVAEQTDLSCVNPLEIPPMGDCDLAELKRLYGGKIVLMGNLHTTEVMLRGTVADVERAARKAIDDAGAGGGFILSTGDQCGRDTPDANIRKLVEVCQTYGRYE